MAATVQYAEERTENKIDEVPALTELIFQWERHFTTEANTHIRFFQIVISFVIKKKKDEVTESTWAISYFNLSGCGMLP